jgi:shikimate kinase
MNIILAGFQGVGKSYFGQKVAERLQRPFFDVDQELVKKHHVPNVRMLYQELGQELFRKKEEECVLELFRHKNSVLALGGGSLLSVVCQEQVRTSGRLIYLELSFNILKTRILEKKLPLFLQNGDAFDELYRQREPLFATLSHSRIELENLTDEEIIERIIACGCK